VDEDRTVETVQRVGVVLGLDEGGAVTEVSIGMTQR